MTDGPSSPSSSTSWESTDLRRPPLLPAVRLPVWVLRPDPGCPPPLLAPLAPKGFSAAPVPSGSEPLSG